MQIKEKDARILCERCKVDIEHIESKNLVKQKYLELLKN